MERKHDINRKTIFRRIIIVLAAFAVVIASESRVYAASAYGSVGGGTASANLSRSNLDATGSTSKTVTDAGYVAVTVWFYFTYEDLSGVRHSASSSAYDEKGSSCSATAVGSGFKIMGLWAESDHVASYYPDTWTKHLIQY